MQYPQCQIGEHRRERREPDQMPCNTEHQNSEMYFWVMRLSGIWPQKDHFQGSSGGFSVMTLFLFWAYPSSILTSFPAAFPVTWSSYLFYISFSHSWAVYCHFLVFFVNIEGSGLQRQHELEWIRLPNHLQCQKPHVHWLWTWLYGCSHFSGAYILFFERSELKESH